MKIRNLVVADKIGLTESGVSLLRNGRRFPRVETMESIEKAYGWPVASQFRIRPARDYGKAFESMLQDWYAEHGVVS